MEPVMRARLAPIVTSTVVPVAFVEMAHVPQMRIALIARKIAEPAIGAQDILAMIIVAKTTTHVSGVMTDGVIVTVSVSGMVMIVLQSHVEMGTAIQILRIACLAT